MNKQLGLATFALATIALTSNPAAAFVSPDRALQAPECETVSSVAWSSLGYYPKHANSWRGYVAYAMPTPAGGDEIFVHDIAHDTSLQVSSNGGALGGYDDVWPAFVDDDLLVYVRRYAAAADEMRAVWFGPDSIPGTPDDVSWTFDASSGPNATFSRPQANVGGEIAYLTEAAPQVPLDIRYCTMQVGSAHACAAGSIYVHVPGPATQPWSYAGRAFPVGGSVIWRAFGSSQEYEVYDVDVATGQQNLWWSDPNYMQLDDATGPFVLFSETASPGSQAVLTLAGSNPRPTLYTGSTPGAIASSNAIGRHVGSDGYYKIARLAWNTATPDEDVFVSTWGSVSATVGIEPGTVASRNQAPTVSIDGDFVTYEDQGGLSIDRCVFP